MHLHLRSVAGDQTERDDLEDDRRAATRPACCPECGEVLSYDGEDDERGYCPACDLVDVAGLPPRRGVPSYAVRW